MKIVESFEEAVAIGAETIIKDGDTEYRCYMPGEIERPVVEAIPPVPTLSAWQIRKALNQMGLREAVEAAVAAGPQDAKDAWAYANEFERDHYLIESFAQALGKSDEDIDALFALGATL